jgi:hypothetical protein
MTQTEWGRERPRHTCRSRLIDDDPIAADTEAARREIERQDRQFVAVLRFAILSGAETAKGVLGHVARRRPNSRGRP